MSGKPKTKSTDKRIGRKKGGKNPKRKYTDKEKVVALAAVETNGGNVKGTSTELGIPTSTLEYWNKGGLHPDIAKIRDEKRGVLADGLEEIAWLIIGLLPKTLMEAPAKDQGIILGIVVDKLQVLKGLPNSIAGQSGLTDEQIDSRLRSWADSVRKRITANGNPGGKESPDGDCIPDAGTPDLEPIPEQPPGDSLSQPGG